MASKQFTLASGIVVNIFKHRGSRSLRISLPTDGTVRVTIPSWAPYISGLRFAESRQAWIAEHQHTARLLFEGQAIGKAHHLYFEASAAALKPTTRIKTNVILVMYPNTLQIDDIQVQSAAHKGCIRALRLESEQLLPIRLKNLAEMHDFSYKSVSVRQLTGRWGSCDTHTNIVLNIFLMQLPWELIDYVLLHELTHTRVMKHGPDFWTAMRAVLPSVQERRKAIKKYRPVLGNSDTSVSVA